MKRYRKLYTIHLIAQLVILPFFLFFSTVVSGEVVKLRGKILNGTTGELGRAESVVLYRLAEGMENIDSAGDVQGEFILNADLPKTACPHLLMAVYKGIAYNHRLSLGGQDSPEEITIPVYEITSSPEDFSYRIPHLFIRREGEFLSLHVLFEISNNTNPPRTWYHPEGTFRFYLPGDKRNEASVSVSTGNVPVPVEPVETADKNIYTVDYGIKPGTTSLTIAYAVEYCKERFTFHQPVLYPLEEFKLFIAPPDIQVTAPEFVRQDIEPSQGFAYFLRTDIEAGNTLDIQLSGGSMRAQIPQERQQQRIVKIKPVVSQLTFPIFLTIFIVLIFGTVVLVHLERSNRNNISTQDYNREQLKVLRDRLIAEIAEWDNRYTGNSVSEDVYRVEREKIKQRLIIMLQQLNAASDMEQ